MSVIIFNPDKKGLSIMIGYILLITSAVAMGAIVFQWMKTYVPKDAISCPDGVSLFISKTECIEGPSGEGYDLTLTINNNGRFDVAGYFVHGTGSEEQTLATLDLSGNYGDSDYVQNGAVFYQLMSGGLANSFLPTAENWRLTFEKIPPVYSVEIIPIRFQVHENKKRIVSCGNAKIFERVGCGDGSNPGGIIVGDDNGDGDGPVEPACSDDSECDVVAGEVCVSGSCTLCGNGVIDSGEQCDDGNNVDGDGCDGNCQME